MNVQVWNNLEICSATATESHFSINGHLFNMFIEGQAHKKKKENKIRLNFQEMWKKKIKHSGGTNCILLPVEASFWCEGQSWTFAISLKESGRSGCSVEKRRMMSGFEPDEERVAANHDHRWPVCVLAVFHPAGGAALLLSAWWHKPELSYILSCHGSQAAAEAQTLAPPSWSLIGSHQPRTQKWHWASLVMAAGLSVVSRKSVPFLGWGGVGRGAGIWWN